MKPGSQSETYIFKFLQLIVIQCFSFYRVFLCSVLVLVLVEQQYEADTMTEIQCNVTSSLNGRP